MRYTLKKRCSLAERYVIQDADQNPVYRVEGDSFSWGRNLAIVDGSGQQVARVEQPSVWASRYLLHRPGRAPAVLSKAGGWFSCQYVLEVPGSEGFTLGRSWSGSRVSIEQGGVAVGVLRRREWSWTETLTLDLHGVDNEHTLDLLTAFSALGSLFSAETTALVVILAATAVG